MTKPLDITAEIDILKNGSNGTVSEPHHLKHFNESRPEFFNDRAVARFVEANVDMLVSYFIKETIGDSGLNLLNRDEIDLQADLVEELTTHLLSIHERIDPEEES